MIPEFGHYALILALCLAMLQAAVLPLLSRRPMGQMAWLTLTKPIAFGQTCFVLISFFCLMTAFIQHDFSVAYVAENSNTHLPLLYRISAVWGAHEGSLLLWVTLLSLWTTAVACFSQTLSPLMLSRILSVLAWISVGFFLFLLTTSNPFARLLTDTPLEGRDLNPLLQDIGLAMHPPVLYTGYVGFAVTFAFAIAALWSGHLDKIWVRNVRPWTIIAWCALSLGITSGSWWAYRELGWGGWWFWDPVENASFLPWLAATALLHSLSVTEKRDAFKGWTVLLAILTFSLSLMGTFLVRSGILTSVHAFVSDPNRGVFMLRFLFLVIGCSLLLYAVRTPKLHNTGHFQYLSKETCLLINNVFLVAAMAAILLGTLYPLVLDAFNLGKISVGPPYFNQVFVPFVWGILFFMAIAPHCSWQRAEALPLLKRFLPIAVISIIIGLCTMRYLSPLWHWKVVAGVSGAVWVILGTGYDAIKRFRTQGGWLLLTCRQYAMWTAHIGVAVAVLGVTLSSAYSVQRDVSMTVGDTLSLNGYTIQFLNLHEIAGANYTAIRAEFNVNRGDDNELIPAEKRLYTAQNSMMTEAGISATFFRDIYIALGEPLTKTRWSIRLYYKPAVRWIWLGGLLITLGGSLVLFDYYHLRRRNKHAH